ncbi:MAG: hypothetical protein WBA10_10350 [Elainellaceae cyanobacterium]
MLWHKFGSAACVSRRLVSPSLTAERSLRLPPPLYGKKAGVLAIIVAMIDDQRPGEVAEWSKAADC